MADRDSNAAEQWRVARAERQASSVADRGVPAPSSEPCTVHVGCRASEHLSECPVSERPDIDRLADTLRDSIERAYARGKALYPKAPPDAYDGERDDSLVALDELVALALEREMLRGQIATVKRHMNGRCDHLAERAEAAEARVAELEAALRIYREAYAAVLAHAEGLRMDTPEDERVRLNLVQLLHEVAALSGAGGSR